MASDALRRHANQAIIATSLRRLSQRHLIYVLENTPATTSASTYRWAFSPFKPFVPGQAEEPSMERKPRVLTPEEAADAALSAESEAAELEIRTDTLNALMTEVKSHLVEIVADVEFSQPRALLSFEWLRSNPSNVLMFLNSASSTIDNGVVRRYRGSINGQVRIPTSVAHFNGMNYRNAISAIFLRLLESAKKHSSGNFHTDRLLQAIGETYVLQSKEAYNTDELNPVYVWDAYTVCRSLSWKLPDWILEYFDQSARNVQTMVKRSNKRTEKDIPKIFGFSRPVEGADTALTRARNRLRDEAIFSYLHSMRGENGEWTLAIMNSVPGRSSHDASRKAYKRVRARIGMEPKELHPTKGRRKGNA